MSVPELEAEVVKLAGSACGKQARAGASRARSGERDASKGNFIVIVSLPRQQGGTGYLPAKGVIAEILSLIPLLKIFEAIALRDVGEN